MLLPVPSYCRRRASSRRKGSRSIRTTRKSSKNTITATTSLSWRIPWEKEFGVTTSHLTQLIACTGAVVCRVPSADGKRIYTYQGSGNIALQPNILVTVKHAFQDLGTGQLLPIDTCRFHNWKNPNDEIAIIIDDPSQLPPIATSMSKTPELKRRDLTAVRLAHPVEGCQPLAIPEKRSDAARR